MQELPLRFDSQSDSGTTLQLAREQRLSLYDAVYLELAIRWRLPLLTFDAHLEEAAKRMDVGNCNLSGARIKASTNVQKGDLYPVAGLFAG